MDDIVSLAFPYVESGRGNVVLNKVYFTNQADTLRYSVVLEEKQGHRECISISKIRTPNHEPVDELMSFIQNPSKTSTPLLTRFSPRFNRIKLNISVKPGPQWENKSLIILKTLADNDEGNVLREELQSADYTNKRIEISKLAYSNMPIDDTNPNYQRIIINDSFNEMVFHDNRMNMSLWEHDNACNEYVQLFDFKVWIDENTVQEVESPIKSGVDVKPEEANEVDTQTGRKVEVGRNITYGRLSEYRRALKFNIEDGPEFRRTLTRYEFDIPTFKKLCSKFTEELKNLELFVRKITSSKMRLIELVNEVTNLHFNTLLKQFHFRKDFKRSIEQCFAPVERNLNFFIKDVCDAKLLSKVSTTLSNNSLTGDSSGSSELLRSKKNFELTSKEYYSWLNKYLSNDKERPDLKLLLKRKSFELSKLDYLNQLNMLLNNQYINQLLENFFKFINLSLNHKTLSLDMFKDTKLVSNLLVGNYEIYLTVLSKFNSEKRQFRQMIEACQSNEELTNVLKGNSVIFTYSEKTSNESDEDPYITKENLDLIFSVRAPGNINTINAIPVPVDDQNSEMAGILYALGGQGKQGWHKEWVVLKKGQLIEYSDWRRGQLPINKPIEIALSNVKATTYEKRQNCFEILTSQGDKHIFQAISALERERWIKALYNAGQLVDTTRIQIANKGHKKEKEKRKNLGHLITDLTNIERPLILAKRSENSLLPVSIHHRSPLIDKDYLKMVRSDQQKENGTCVDCGSTDSVEWVSINLLVVFCVKCSSCHRNLGSHISKIRSLKLDIFENETELLLKYVNNKAANEYLEYSLNSEDKIDHHVSDERRLNFIKEKYVLKSYMTIFTDINDLLVKAIQNIDIPEVVKYVTCGGDINMLVRVHTSANQGTQTITLLEYSLRKFVEVNDGSKLPKRLFVITELLVLNGYRMDNLESLSKDLDLSTYAIDYWNSRRLKQAGIKSP